MSVFYAANCFIAGYLIFSFVGDKGAASESLTRNKRETRQCKDKYVILRTHSACKPPSPRVQNSTAITASDIQAILQEHNNYRAAVTPPAANMMKMYWDEEVAQIAQAWADTCAFGHDKTWDRSIPGGLSLGQNIGRGYLNWPACIKAWNDEVKDFRYGEDIPFEKVGHYTQLVWGITNTLGCGVAFCGQYNFHVCNYGPAGNVGAFNKPYKEAQSSCADCTSNCDQSSKLCDCQTTTCENEGTLDPSTCHCTCKYQDFQIQPVCKLNCDTVTQPYMCGTGSYDKAACRTYPNSVPSACPLTCGICPYAGFNYTEVGIDPIESSSSASNYILFYFVILLRLFAGIFM